MNKKNPAMTINGANPIKRRVSSQEKTKPMARPVPIAEKAESMVPMRTPDAYKMDIKER